MSRVHTLISIMCGLPGLRSSRQRWVIGLALAVVLCLSCWVTREWYWLRQEQEAVAILQRDYHAMVLAHSISSATPDWTPGLDLREF